MATSGSTNWSLTRDQLITSALRKLGVLASGGTPSSAQLSDGSDALNAIVKAFQADGMPLWKITSTTFATVADTSTYNIGVSQTVNTIGKPLKIIQAFYTVDDGVNVPMNIYNKYDFNNLPDNAEGTPITLYYQPLNTYGTIHLWPTPTDTSTDITVYYQTQYEDMDSGANDFDFPSEWMQAIIYTLAWSLAPEFGIPPTDRGLLMKEAEYWKDYVLSMGSEEGGIFIQPDWTGR